MLIDGHLLIDTFLQCVRKKKRFDAMKNEGFKLLQHIKCLCGYHHRSDTYKIQLLLLFFWGLLLLLLYLIIFG